jgi:hypothetical protein
MVSFPGPTPSVPVESPAPSVNHAPASSPLVGSFDDVMERALAQGSNQDSPSSKPSQHPEKPGRQKASFRVASSNTSPASQSACATPTVLTNQTPKPGKAITTAPADVPAAPAQLVTGNSAAAGTLAAAAQQAVACAAPPLAQPPVQPATNDSSRTLTGSVTPGSSAPSLTQTAQIQVGVPSNSQPAEVTTNDPSAITSQGGQISAVPSSGQDSDATPTGQGFEVLPSDQNPAISETAQSPQAPLAGQNVEVPPTGQYAITSQGGQISAVPSSGHDSDATPTGQGFAILPGDQNPVISTPAQSPQAPLTGQNVEVTPTGQYSLTSLGSQGSTAPSNGQNSDVAPTDQSFEIPPSARNLATSPTAQISEIQPTGRGVEVTPTGQYSLTSLRGQVSAVPPNGQDSGTFPTGQGLEGQNPSVSPTAQGSQVPLAGQSVEMTPTGQTSLASLSAQVSTVPLNTGTSGISITGEGLEVRQNGQDLPVSTGGQDSNVAPSGQDSDSRPASQGFLTPTGQTFLISTTGQGSGALSGDQISQVLPGNQTSDGSPKPTVQPANPAESGERTSNPAGESLLAGTPVQNSPDFSEPAFHPVSAITSQAPAASPGNGDSEPFGAAPAVAIPIASGSDLPDVTAAQSAPNSPINIQSPAVGNRQSPIIDPQSPTSNPASDLLGTPVAQQEPLMKKAEKTLKSAELAQQNLPGDTLLSAARQNSPGEHLSANSPAHAENTVSLTSAAPSGASPEASASISASSTNVPAAADARLQSLERTQDLVSLHALRLRESGNDTLRVVIEPGSGTRLSLELRWGNDGIQAQAQLHNGDFEYLSGHWAELQQRLEPRGIHLAALECSGQSMSDNKQFRQRDQQPAGEQSAKSAFADFAFGNSMAGTPAGRGRSKTHSGFETWA